MIFTSRHRSTAQNALVRGAFPRNKLRNFPHENDATRVQRALSEVNTNGMFVAHNSLDKFSRKCVVRYVTPPGEKLAALNELF
jgi:hypothetical protein